MVDDRDAFYIWVLFFIWGGGVKIMYNLDGVYRYTAPLLH